MPSGPSLLKLSESVQIAPFARNRQHPANPTPLPRFHIIRSSAKDVPFDGSRPADFDIGAAMSRYGFPESADWRALGDVCALWDEVGRARIQAWTHNLADYLRQRIAAVFGDDAFLQPTIDPALKSAIVCFNPFPDVRQRRDPDFNRKFRERLLLEQRPDPVHRVRRLLDDGFSRST